MNRPTKTLTGGTAATLCAISLLRKPVKASSWYGCSEDCELDSAGQPRALCWSPQRRTRLEQSDHVTASRRFLQL